MTSGAPQAGGGKGQPDAQQRRGLSLATLIVAAFASGTAAVLSSLFWSTGTVISAAITPVIVTLIRETLQRPANRIADASKSKLASTITPAKPLSPPGRPSWLKRLSLSSRGGERNAAQSAPYTRVYGRRAINPKRVLITAGLAFVTAAVVLTLAELVFGGAIGTNSATTFFGGSNASQNVPTPTPTETTTGGESSKPSTSTNPTTTTETTTGKTSTTSTQPTTPKTTPTQPRQSQQPSGTNTTPP